MAPRSGVLDRLVAGKEIIVVCGPGGVGKTTTAAALGIATVLRTSAKVLVLTVDPARRLGDALGLRGVGDTPTRIDELLFSAVGVHPRGELWAAMVDTRESWDNLIRRQAPNPSVVKQILANPYYQSVTGRFAHSHEYIAMERLYELHASGQFDLVILDTPPSADALDLLDAPEKIAELFSSSLMRILSSSGKSRLASAASKTFSQFADRILGGAVLEEMAAFLVLFQTMREGFVERARSVTALLREPRTTFMVVTTLEASPVKDAARLTNEIARRSLHLGIVVANKTLPPEQFSTLAASASDQLVDRADALARTLAARVEGTAPEAFTRVLRELGENSRRLALAQRREEELASELADSFDGSIKVPHLLRDVVDIAGWIAIGDVLMTAS